MFTQRATASLLRALLRARLRGSLSDGLWLAARKDYARKRTQRKRVNYHPLCFSVEQKLAVSFTRSGGVIGLCNLRLDILF